MPDRFYRYRKLVVLFLLALLLKLFSLNERWVEQYYANGVYPYLARGLRYALGWIPFSVGDVLYGAAAVFLVYKFIVYLRLLRKSGRGLLPLLLRKIVVLGLWVYLVFNIFWGLNYQRRGIAEQLNLTVQPYSTGELLEATTLIQQRLNNHATLVREGARRQLEHNPTLFAQGIAAYNQIDERYPFLSYTVPSVKPSLFTFLGHYIGFTGYYNPFSGEAQLKISAPIFLQPFIVNHEIAHQLGYAKENEANFVSYLVGRQAPHAEVRYSTYFEIYLYALGDLTRRDSLAAEHVRKQEHPQVKKDYREFREYLFRNRNLIEPFVSRFYDEYLRWNNQPKGRKTYNEVVTWLIAYRKKFGADKL